MARRPTHDSLRWGVALPNALTILRIPLAGALWIAPDRPAWVLSIMAVAGVTDVLDGWLVRRWRRRLRAEGDPAAYAARASRGAFLDGLADKVFVGSAVLALAVSRHLGLGWVAALLARELALTPLVVVARLAPEWLRDRVDYTSGLPGKAATVAQFAALVLGFLDQPLFFAAALVAAALGLLAVAAYVVRLVRAVRARGTR
ncbi:MAG: CDP-alcohol phosphatidyltransferase family protein [Sandaracinaceae bacterium]